MAILRSRTTDLSPHCRVAVLRPRSNLAEHPNPRSSDEYVSRRCTVGDSNTKSCATSGSSTSIANGANHNGRSAANKRRYRAPLGRTWIAVGIEMKFRGLSKRRYCVHVFVPCCEEYKLTDSVSSLTDTSQSILPQWRRWNNFFLMKLPRACRTHHTFEDYPTTTASLPGTELRSRDS